MKKTLLFLAVWLFTSQYSFCQTTKTDASSINDAKLASSIKPPTNPVGMEEMEYIKPQIVATKGGTAPVTTNSQRPLANLLDKPTIKSHPPIESHTQNLQVKTKVLEANTEALEANTEALRANTQALEANVNAARTNKHLRTMQTQLTANPAGASAKTAMGTNLAAPNTSSVKVPTDRAVKPFVKPLGSNIVKPVKLLNKPQSAQINAPVKITVKPEPVVVAAPAKVSAKPMAMAENSRSISMLMSQPKAPAKITQLPKAIPQANAVGTVKMNKIGKGNSNVTLNDLMLLPLADKMFDGKTPGSKHTPVVAGSGYHEGSKVTTQGYLQVVATEDSAKHTETYSLQLTAMSQGGDSCFMVKISTAELADLTSNESAENAKKFIREHLVKGKVPCTGGNLMRTPVYVSVTGDLAYDAVHAGEMRGAKPVYQGKRGMHAYTPWQIKNVSHIEFTMP